MKNNKKSIITNTCRDYIDLISVVISVIISFVASEAIKSVISEAIANQRGNTLIGGELFIYSAIFAALFYIIFQITQIIGHVVYRIFIEVCGRISEI